MLRRVSPRAVCVLMVDLRRALGGAMFRLPTPPAKGRFTHQRRPTFSGLRPTHRTTLLVQHHTTFRWHTHMMAANFNSREWEAAYHGEDIFVAHRPNINSKEQINGKNIQGPARGKREP